MAEALAEGFELPPLSPVGLATVLAFPTERDDLADAVERAETAIAESRHADAVDALQGIHRRGSAPRLVLRALFAESWARMILGDLQTALALAENARALAEADLGGLDRAEALYRLGCVRFKLSQVSIASALFTLGLELCDRSGQQCDPLRGRLHEWRSRCRQRHREWDPARADAERALELATLAGDPVAVADAQFQASLVAERTGQRLLARFYAEEALTGFEEARDRLMVARTLNNLGGLTFLLGETDEAVARLESAAAVAREVGSDADEAQAVSSLAQVHLRSGRPELAELEARAALEALDGRVDFADELGNAQLVLGRALLAQGRHDEAAGRLRDAEETFARIGADSQRAAVWVAQGDLAHAGGDVAAGAELYRRAADSLQDFHF